MRRSWPANLIAAITIAVTLGVGALGALGSPKANGDAGRTSRGSATEVPSPTCHGRLSTGPLSFGCPSGWWVWENGTVADDPYANAQTIISNHRPLEQGSDGLPDGWFKVDMYVAPRDPSVTFQRIANEPCTPSEDTTLESCAQITIDGRPWMQRIERDPFTTYRSIATVVDGVEMHVIAIVPDGSHAADGDHEIAVLFSSLSIR